MFGSSEKTAREQKKPVAAQPLAAADNGCAAAREAAFASEPVFLQTFSPLTRRR
jgi:hypothetical protein